MAYSLNPNSLAVESFEAEATTHDQAAKVTTGGQDTMAPGCTAFPELCPTKDTTVPV